MRTRIVCVRIATSLLLLLLGAACNVAPGAAPPAPVRTINYDEVATGATKDGQPITVTTVSVVQEEKDAQGNLGGYSSENKMQVSRAGTVYRLQSSDKPNTFGCQTEAASYENFGCYFGTARLIDLDHDGEPEIVSEWEQGGSAGYQSLHIYRWDGNAYILVGMFMEMQLQYEAQDLDRDGRAELVLRYVVGPTMMSVPWIDIYSLSNGKLVSANKQYPAYFQDLLTMYNERLADLQGAGGDGDTRRTEALAEIQKRIEMAQAIVGTAK